MPPHSSHFLQPLDVACFLALKRSYGSLIQEKMRVGINHIDKDDFLELYLQARTAVFTSTSIRSGFKATRLVPFNPDQVLEQLHVQLRTPTPLLLASAQEAV
jgi:hypothetical protein